MLAHEDDELKKKKTTKHTWHRYTNTLRTCMHAKSARTVAMPRRDKPTSSKVNSG